VVASPPEPAPQPPGLGTSLYVHVPFCVVKCGYCDFNSYVVEQPEVMDRFLDALDAELQLRWRHGPPTTIFIGGGTPSHLDVPRLERLFAILARHVDLRACTEVTMEANPESLTTEKAMLARTQGVGRLSIGFQSFAAASLRFLDRAHSAERAQQAFAEARAAGHTNVNIDLIFALPGQTLAEWEADLRAALVLRPDHLSCYNLTYEPGTRLYRDLQQQRVQPNDEETDRAMFLRTRQMLLDAGFRAYEVSNFAGAGGPCRHNDHYWLQGDYVGVGPGAASHRAGVRATNLKPVESWAAAVLAGLPAAATAETLTPRQRAGEAVWLGIRRTEGVDLGFVAARLGMPVAMWFAETAERHERAGLVHREGDRLRLTDVGLLLADQVGAAYLQTPIERALNASVG
jgi:putative oxygen-independent coproporphyrinogen III oxidase